MRKLLLCCLLCCLSLVQAKVKIASTTSTQNSGLYDYLIPLIEADIGEDIHVISVGTGQALKLAENGDVDLLIVHAPDKEKDFVAAGYGINRQPFMYNQFMLVGPQNDPANIHSAKTINEAMSRLATAGQKKMLQFVSRGDRSGTHFKEQQLWQIANLNQYGDWYLESGSGMGATLNIAAAQNAYTLSDSSTWLNFGNKQKLTVLFHHDPRLFNQYSVIEISTDKHPHIHQAKAREIAEWLVSDKGQQAINAYQIHGQQAFTANANKRLKLN